MEIPPTPDDDVLADRTRGRLFEALTRLRRPAPTADLARLVERHPNAVRAQMRRLEHAGLVECRSMPQPRGRPRHEWAIAPRAMPAGRPPEAYGDLGRWLARAIGADGVDLDLVERTGREIGRELAPTPHHDLAQALCDALTAMGFAPRADRVARGGRLRYVLGNCPYRDAVRENQTAVCGLHRGITQGLLDGLDPQARLSDFIPRDPYTAGCVIDVARG
jgi:predicted ArsR family transcriptional regulator